MALFTSAFNSIKNMVINLINVILAFLPDCPFESYINATVNNTTLKYVNWFIPVGDIIAIGEVWLVAIAVFYIYQIALRWLKAIE